ncbi:hypothetical protein [Microbacterium halophytorum]|uniref:hypothetical protein n=1 Tax=Microbacterium halophytorum TaxID=2067568 RepID=UPI000CFD0331|nr:hypothetical protein [Microbacterium halophytorum]
MTSTGRANGGDPRLTTVRMIAGSFAGMVVLLGVVVALIVPSEQWFTGPGAIGLALPAAGGALGLVLMLTMGHHVPALPPTTPADQAASTAFAAFQSTLFVRLAAAELPTLVGIAAVFIADEPSAIPYLIGGAISLVLHAVYAFPTAASVRRIERRLDREGGHSRLADSLGLGSGPGSGYTGSATII